MQSFFPAKKEKLQLTTKKKCAIIELQLAIANEYELVKDADDVVFWKQEVYMNSLVFSQDVSTSNLHGNVALARRRMCWDGYCQSLYH